MSTSPSEATPRRRLALCRSAHKQGERGTDRAANRPHRQGPPEHQNRVPAPVIDGHSRIAYVEIHSDDKAVTATGVLHRAVTWFADRGVTVERVLYDNGSCYRSFAWADACTNLGIAHKRTRRYRPQTNGKIERFHRTLADGWAYARLHDSEAARRAALPGWIHFYNHHRIHSAVGDTPIGRLNNPPGHHTQPTPVTA